MKPERTHPLWQHRPMGVFLFAVGLIGLVAGGFGSPIAGAAFAQDHGVPVDTYPVWQERVMAVAINACRMAPEDFRDEYLQYSGILQPAYYPPVAPLVWCEELNHSARYHSEDMASCDTFSHTSCDGTDVFTRIRTFYDYPVSMGECIHVYYSPFVVVVQWLEDNGAADSSSLDGHRAIVMKWNFTEGGGGYAYNPATTYQNWYTYDFGGRDLGDPPVLVDGAHLFINNGSTSFWANYYEPDTTGPQSARVYVDGQRHDLSLHLGSSATGTWAVDLPSATACRSYTFQFVDAAGSVHWYPESGSLRTWDEGGCTEDYVAGATGVPVANAGSAVFESVAPNPFNPSTTIHFRLAEPGDVRLTILDARGRLVRTLLVAPLGEGSHTATWHGRTDAGQAVGSGTYFALLSGATGETQVRKLTLIK